MKPIPHEPMENYHPVDAFYIDDARSLYAEVHHLLKKARTMGMVITVTQEPTKPLRMGGVKDTVVINRLRRKA